MAVDAAGFGLLIAAVLFGWLPGPGGIPLVIAGLSLLAINYEWAKRLKDRARSGSLMLTNNVFANHPAVKWLVDIIGAGLVVLAVFIARNYTGSIWRTVAIVVGFLGLWLFLGNRRRLQRFTRLIKRK